MNEQPYQLYAGNIAAVKRFFGSVKVLILGIFYAVFALVSLILIVTKSSYGFLQEILEMAKAEVGVRDSSYSFFSAASTSLNTSYLISGVLIPLLIALAFILMFVKSRNQSPQSDPMAGLTIMLVLAVIAFVQSIINVVLNYVYLGLFASFYASMKSSSGYYDSTGRYHSSSSTDGFLVLVIIAGVCVTVYSVVSIIYAVNYKNFYRSARRSLRSERLEYRGASVYGVFCIIMAAFEAIRIIAVLIFRNKVFSLLSAGSRSYYFGYTPSAVGYTILSMMNVAILIFTAVIALSYRKQVSAAASAAGSQPFNRYGSADNSFGQQAYPSAPYQPPVQNYNNTYQPPVQNNTNTYTPYPSAVTCPNCGHTAQPGEVFCQNCGTRL